MPPTSPARTTPPHHDLFSSGGEMGALMRTVDWSQTELGPVEAWPQPLRTMVGVVLASRFPMMVWWGPRLLQLYNDGYRQILGGKHPRSLGAPGPEAWAEIWPVVGPMVEGIRQGGEATWSEHLLLYVNRRGYLEETYFTFSYSAVPGEHERVGGVLVTVQETTAQVLGERRLRTLQALTAEAFRAVDVDEATRAAMAALAGNPRDVPFALLYRLDGAEARLTEASGLDAPTLAALGADAWPLAEACASSGPLELAELPAPLRARLPLEGETPAERALVLPVQGGPGEQACAVLVAGVSARLELDASYRGFLALVATHLSTAIANARAHEEQRQRAQALAALDRAKTDFFSNVSHEFRTPLTLMLGPVEDGLHDAEQPLPPRQRERQEAVHRNTLRLLRLVNTLLDFSRIEAGRVQAHYQPTDLGALTQDLASAFRSVVEKAGLALEVDCPTLPEPVWVDRGLWEKVVLNLLSNAFKFTLQGRIGVALALEGGRAVLRVEDTGAGIPADELPRLFERFHRVRGTHGRSHEGSGIGLALVNELVKLHGGTIAVQSEAGRGTRFEVALPLGTEHLPREQLDATPGPTARGSAAAAYVSEAAQWLPGAEPEQAAPETELPAARGSVLLADDNADVRAYVSRLLRAQGWRVEAVGDGAVALERARATRPDLVLTDVMMPGLDGFALLEALEQDARTRHAAVVMLSARAGEEARLEGLKAGADDYLVKPFTARDLVTRVSVHLEAARARRETAERQQHLDDIFMQAPALLAITRGPDHVFELANPLYRQLMGGRSLVGKPIREALPELEGQVFYGLLDQVFRTGEPHVGREVPARLARTPDGQLEDGFFTFVFQPMRDPAGRVDGVLIFAFEVTDQVLARQRVETLMAELQLADQRKDEFLAMLAHELRNPLAAISMALSLLERTGHDPERAARHHATARRQMGNLVRLVDDLLDVSRITRGKVELRRDEVDLVAVVQAAVAATRPALEAREHALSVELEPGPVRLVADGTRLEQVVTNLLTNAAKYTPPRGQVRVTLAREPGRDGAPAEAVLRVRDTGRGIPREMQDKVFDMFVQVDTALDRSGGGLGIGLTLVKRLVELHGGRVSAHSEGPGRGSELVVRLPLPPGATAAPAPAQGEAPAGEGRLRVLLVEDSEDVREALSELLESMGHEVHVAPDGPSGLERLLALKPDLGLLDIGLPGLDGYGVAERARAAPGGDTLFLVALTGYGDPASRERAHKAGFDLHFTKPLDLSALPGILERASRQRAARPSA